MIITYYNGQGMVNQEENFCLLNNNQARLQSYSIERNLRSIAEKFEIRVFAVLDAVKGSKISATTKEIK